MAFTPRYSKSSPYGVTPLTTRYMTYYVHRSILPDRRDRLFILNDQRYHHRPENLAVDIYGDEDLFWVIPVRNGLEDPVFDMKFGMEIIIPHPEYIRTLV